MADKKLSKESGKLLGVLGGMGPEATVSFFSKIVEKTPASTDQDHIESIIFNNTKIPDRTSSIMSGNHNVLDFLIKGIRFLINSNVDLITIPCVSAHYYFEHLVQESAIPILSIIDETAKNIAKNGSGITKVGILGTDLTVKKALFTSAFEKLSIRTVIPKAKIQKDSVMKAIYLIKAGDKIGAGKVIEPAVSDLISNDVQRIVAGCTEIPLILESITSPVPTVDTLDCLAEAVVRELI